MGVINLSLFPYHGLITNNTTNIKRYCTDIEQWDDKGMLTVLFSGKFPMTRDTNLDNWYCVSLWDCPLLPSTDTNEGQGSQMTTNLSGTVYKELQIMQDDFTIHLFRSCLKRSTLLLCMWQSRQSCRCTPPVVQLASWWTPGTGFLTSSLFMKVCFKRSMFKKK